MSMVAEPPRVYRRYHGSGKGGGGEPGSLGRSLTATASI
jgi:hypothetical protein